MKPDGYKELVAECVVLRKAQLKRESDKEVLAVAIALLAEAWEQRCKERRREGFRRHAARREAAKKRAREDGKPPRKDYVSPYARGAWRNR